MTVPVHLFTGGEINMPVCAELPQQHHGFVDDINVHILRRLHGARRLLPELRWQAGWKILLANPL